MASNFKSIFNNFLKGLISWVVIQEFTEAAFQTLVHKVLASCGLCTNASPNI